MPAESKRRQKHVKQKNQHKILKNGKNLIFGEGSVNKNLCYKSKLPINIDKVDIVRIIESSKDSYGKN